MDIPAEVCEEQIKEAFREGRKKGIRDYSWMKNGITYVGTTGKTLKEALEEID